MVTHPGRALGHLEKSEPGFLSLQFQTELRKILVSLIEVAQKLLALNPDAVELFKKANGMRAPGWPGPAFRPPRAVSGAVSARTVPIHTAHDPCVTTGKTERTVFGLSVASGSCPACRLRVPVSLLRLRGFGVRGGPRAPGWEAALALPGPHRWPRLLPAAMLDEEEDGRVDEAALRQLTEMGFPESRAAKALRLNQYVRATSSPCC